MNDSGGIGTGLLKWLLFELVAIAGLITVVVLGGVALSAAVVVAVVALPIVAFWMIVRRSRSRVR